ncbi:cytochrome P450 [Actinoplanes oblitus]|uniref:Cytochrome P450 n=1 Tax=Actinoplanes oblitus TaxID=3040509 RepID=A0ABY8WSZ2_9ACTN|nr:cytochrome P450 [Actinoplanes oblitus]WIM99980.1 cytochrome P450 [Actinoplanes oblitus]
MKLDPFGTIDSTYSNNPAATWKKLLGFGGSQVFHDPELGLWLIAGYDNVRSALTDSRRFSNAATLAPIRPLSDATAEALAGFDAPDVLVSADAPQHTLIRATLRALFPNTSARAEHAWAALIAARVDQLVDDLAGQDNTDLMRTVAARLPLLVILDILGIAADDLHTIPGWADGFLDLVWGDLGPDAQLAAAHGFVDFWHLCRSTVTTRASQPDPGPGLIGDLLRHQRGNDARLSMDKIAALVLNLTVAGWESTTGALGHALEHGLTDPHRWAQLADDEHYLATHVEESLRHSPAVDGWPRITTTEVTLDGTVIPAGSRCLLLIGSANHDPRVYGTPDRFDPGRAWLSQHLSFGAGPHYCIGAALARLEITTTLRTLARRFPHLRLADDYQRRFRPNVAARTHQSLPATTGTATRCPYGHDTSSGTRP